MSNQNPIQVVYLAHPSIGVGVPMLLNGQNVMSPTIIDIRTDSKYPGWIWIQTQQGTVYAGTISTSNPTIYNAAQHSQASQIPHSAAPKKRIHPIFWVIAVIFGLTIIGAMTGGNTPESANQTATMADSQETSIEVPYWQLIGDYDANEVAADNTYKDKIISVSGTITSIGKDITDTPYVCIGEEYKYVQCLFPDNPEKLASLSKGQLVMITGKCTGKALGTVLVDDCTIR